MNVSEIFSNVFDNEDYLKIVRAVLLYTKRLNEIKLLIGEERPIEYTKIDKNRGMISQRIDCVDVVLPQITLEDILQCIYKNGLYGFRIEKDVFIEPRSFWKWQLGKPLHEQSIETITKLASLIKNEDENI